MLWSVLLHPPYSGTHWAGSLIAKRIIATLGQMELLAVSLICTIAAISSLNNLPVQANRYLLLLRRLLLVVIGVCLIAFLVLPHIFNIYYVA